MKINYLIETLHQYYIRYKNTFLTVFSLCLFLLIGSSKMVYGDSVVTTIPTQINFVENGKVISFVTKENTLANALAVQGIILDKNDITEPPLSTPLVGQKVDATLVPALPVLIDDNGQSWVGKSAYSGTDQILGQLGVKVDPADIVSRNIILDPVTDMLAGQKITIERAPVYTVSVDDGQVIVHSWSKTVSTVLKDGKITLNQNDTTSPGRGDLAPVSGQIEVTRVNYADITETVAIDYDTIEQPSYDLYQGQSQVLQTGINGSKTQTVHIVYHNGVEVSREVISSLVLSEPQDKVIEIGKKPYNSGAWWDTLVAAGNAWGVSPVDMFNVMNCESGGNPYSGWYYRGLFQYSPDTWAGASASYPGGQYSGAAITDGNAQIWVTAWKVSQSGWSAWSCKP